MIGVPNHRLATVTHKFLASTQGQCLFSAVGHAGMCQRDRDGEQPHFEALASRIGLSPAMKSMLMSLRPSLAKQPYSDGSVLLILSPVAESQTRLLSSQKRLLQHPVTWPPCMAMPPEQAALMHRSTPFEVDLEGASQLQTQQGMLAHRRDPDSRGFDLAHHESRQVTLWYELIGAAA